MTDSFSAVPVAMRAFSATNQAAAATICGAASADSQAMLAAAAAALGPIGAGYLAAYAPAQVNNLTTALLLGHVHAAICAATDRAAAAIIAADTA